MAGSLGASGGISLDELTADAVEFDNSVNGFTSTEVQSAIEEAKATGDSAIFPVNLLYNGNVADGTFLRYSNLTPSTPVIVPVDSLFLGFTFSNSRSNADYTIEFRNNSDVGATFYTVSKVNTQFFVDILVTPESFLGGDAISVKYLDDGNNANDVAVYLVFKAVT